MQGIALITQNGYIESPDPESITSKAIEKQIKEVIGSSAEEISRFFNIFTRDISNERRNAFLISNCNYILQLIDLRSCKIWYTQFNEVQIQASKQFVQFQIHSQFNDLSNYVTSVRNAIDKAQIQGNSTDEQLSNGTSIVQSIQSEDVVTRIVNQLELNYLGSLDNLSKSTANSFNSPFDAQPA
ncbi:MAG: hypothetical protein EZS28_052433, partial [Streblomastix strix]